MCNEKNNPANLNHNPAPEDDAHRTLEETQSYWANPSDDNNHPQRYIGEKKSQQQRSAFLVELIQNHVDQDAKLFELGCNVGRNLNYLYKAGFRGLSAIEINEKAMALLRENFPEMADDSDLYVGPAEEQIKHLGDGSFDLVFTMAVLEHIHTDSEWMFGNLCRISRRWLITIEDEENTSWRHFPRNYRQVFEELGMTQVTELQLQLELHGLSSGFQARVFEKQ